MQICRISASLEKPELVLRLLQVVGKAPHWKELAHIESPGEDPSTAPRSRSLPSRVTKPP